MVSVLGAIPYDQIEANSTVEALYGREYEEFLAAQGKDNEMDCY